MRAELRSLNPDFSVAPQLGPDDMPELAKAGFKSVIINRPDGEGGPLQPASALVIAAAQAAGLQVRYQPVVSGAITAQDVVLFGRLLQEMPAPVLAYCRSGARCAELYRLAQAAG